jgi:hypothetical protein
MRGSFAVILTAIVPVGAPLGPALAQQPAVPRLEVSAMVGRAGADGVDFSGTNGGLALGGSVRLRVAGPLSVGAGVHYSDHSLISLSNRLHFTAIYGEARIGARIIGVPARLFVGIRGGWAHELFTVVDWSANGWVAGGVVGVDWRLARLVSVELQVSETAVQLGDRKLPDGTTVPGTSAHGSSTGIQAGVVVTP